MVRFRRTPAVSDVIAVTGAGSGLGRAVLDRLAAREDLGGLVGIDAVPGRVDGVVWRAMDVRDPLLATRLTGVTVLVHLATSYDLALPTSPRRALTVRGTANVLEAAREAGVARVVLCTSADVYGAHPAVDLPLPDGAALRAEPEDDSLLADLVEVERLVDHARRTGLEVTVLRPAALVGLPSSYDGGLVRHLAGPRLLAVQGTEPLWQLCHVEDLVSAVELAATGRLRGSVAVACEGALAQSSVEALAGRRRLELPAAVALSTAQRLQRVGVTTASVRELDHLLAPLVVACDGLRAAGWTPTWTNEDALRAHLQARASEPRPTAYTAAGATVALLGTAALVREARRRRRR